MSTQLFGVDARYQWLRSIAAEKHKCSVYYEGIDDKQMNQRDLMYLYATYIVAHKNWQGDNEEVLRGHNIAGILADPEGNPVQWSRNSTLFNCDGTQHGEVRLIQSYLKSTRIKKLSCHTIYTSLEPCPMCAGMMSMVQVFRTVYGQRDPDFSHSLERLGSKVSETPWGDIPPLERLTWPTTLRHTLKLKLEKGYEIFVAADKRRTMVHFLRSKEAKAVFSEAQSKYDYIGREDMKHIFPINKPIYIKLRDLLTKIPDYPVPEDEMNVNLDAFIKSGEIIYGGYPLSCQAIKRDKVDNQPICACAGKK